MIGLNQDEKHVVYGILDTTTNQFFYVGITTDLLARYTQHMKGRGENEEKDAAIQAIIAKDHIPHMVTLNIVPIKELAEHRESYFIDLFLVYRQPLTNKTMSVYNRTKEEEDTIYNAIKKSRYARWVGDTPTPYSRVVFEWDSYNHMIVLRTYKKPRKLKKTFREHWDSLTPFKKYESICTWIVLAMMVWLSIDGLSRTSFQSPTLITPIVITMITMVSWFIGIVIASLLRLGRFVYRKISR